MRLAALCLPLRLDVPAEKEYDDPWLRPHLHPRPGSRTAGPDPRPDRRRLRRARHLHRVGIERARATRTRPGEYARAPPSSGFRWAWRSERLAVNGGVLSPKLPRAQGVILNIIAFKPNYFG